VDAAIRSGPGGHDQAGVPGGEHRAGFAVETQRDRAGRHGELQPGDGAHHRDGEPQRPAAAPGLAGRHDLETATAGEGHPRPGQYARGQPGRVEVVESGRHGRVRGPVVVRDHLVVPAALGHRVVPGQAEHAGQVRVQRGGGEQRQGAQPQGGRGPGAALVAGRGRQYRAPAVGQRLLHGPPRGVAEGPGEAVPVRSGQGR
jgi:hypothetical protein